MIFDTPPPDPPPLRAAMRAAYRMDETACVEARLSQAALPPDALARIDVTARDLVATLREARRRAGGIDAFMNEYELSSTEGVVLMCLAESLLRIPDAETADRLIRDKIGGADWARHLGHSESVFVNASTWALMLTGRVVALDEATGDRDWRMVLGRLVARSGEPVIRQAVTQAMRIMGRQFVMGRTIDSALERAQKSEWHGYSYSYDMLGEAARTLADAERYLDAYSRAVAAIGQAAAGRGPIDGPGISVKLSALHPRYEFAQADRVMRELVPRLKRIARLARDMDIGLTIDAEEADRFDLSLDVLEAVSADPGLNEWTGLGFVVQAYLKQAVPAIDWLVDMARRHRRRLMLRLVKGAYWDSEIKLTQAAGLDGYPVFTRKASTDVSYIACAKMLFESPDAIYPMFATHNAHTAATVLELAGGTRGFEFQRLHGMGEELYDPLVGAAGRGLRCRVYAPVGNHEDLLAYLVRRLLENGANTSFVNRIVDEAAPIEEIIADPIARVATLADKPHPGIPLPARLFGTARRNSRGVDLDDPAVLAPLKQAMERAAATTWLAGSSGAAAAIPGPEREIRDPADRRRLVGRIVEATPAGALAALERAGRAGPGWAATPAEVRAARLERAADLFEGHGPALMALAIREAGKTVPDAVAELREAVDFLHYYAARARTEFAGPGPPPAPSRASNAISLGGRGVFVCISPWNFPLAIFTGQVSAALAAGNAVLAKPAEQTPLIAAEAVRLLHAAGIPLDVLHLLPGDGPALGGALIADRRVDGVAFTGSTEAARAIHRALAARDGPIVPLIAETGGQNAMIVDSSALPEQVTRDVLASAFDSAGQRCSALRVLFVQDDIADKQLDMLIGAMAELRVGDPALLSTDIGPVIDAEAKAMLDAHARRMGRAGRLLYETPLGAGAEVGTFFAPRVYEIDAIDRLQREVFGPILHVVRYAASRLAAVIDAINGTGYGLTVGIHSRIDSTVRHIHARLRVGNAYVNRNQIGAVVGVQPFGGEGLSGTGPKAGGPRYLHRFAAERLEPAAPATAPAPDPTLLDRGETARARLASDGSAAADEPSPRPPLAALDLAFAAQAGWDATPATTRAGVLERAADRFEVDAVELAALMAQETGLGIAEALAEVQDAAGYQRSCAARARVDFAGPEPLPGPTGERNEIALHGRGVFVCIGPARGPLGLFIAQLAAALAAGNAVLVQPPDAMLRLAGYALRLFHDAGVPRDVLHLLAGDGASLGAALCADPRVAGVAVAGTAETMRAVNRTLAARDGPIAALIATTVGDGGALPGSDPLPLSPRYLHRFATERTLSVDTTAAGGNAALMAMEEQPAA
jgi:RHH-type proline utilization regulon transcriptional repressor/proline dehydrogenase/delta 1-pyrroline-5-carboxylate dehydrogenase